MAPLVNKPTERLRKIFIPSMENNHPIFFHLLSVGNPVEGERDSVVKANTIPL